MERAVIVDVFLRDWRLELSPTHVEHAFNPEWPGGRMAANEKYKKMVV